MKVLIEWETVMENGTSLIIKDPYSSILQRIALQPSTAPMIIDIVLSNVLSSSVMGVWHMSLVDDVREETLASLNFLLLRADIDHLAKFWSVSDICSTANNTSLCRVAAGTTDCFRQHWSSVFFDVKSDW